ncbi:uncharacterized protein TNCV_2167661 [Trichonephila clavipes]|nr:uncharacterized protein TNCV_2167661 [Trichonephila clavipes]
MSSRLMPLRSTVQKRPKSFNMSRLKCPSADVVWRLEERMPAQHRLIDDRNRRLIKIETLSLYGFHFLAFDLLHVRDDTLCRAAEMLSVPDIAKYSDEDIRLNESDCEESTESVEEIDNIPVNPDIHVARDGTECIPHNSNVPGNFATRNVLRQSSGPTNFAKHNVNALTSKCLGGPTVDRDRGNAHPDSSTIIEKYSEGESWATKSKLNPTSPL